MIENLDEPRVSAHGIPGWIVFQLAVMRSAGRFRQKGQPFDRGIDIADPRVDHCQGADDSGAIDSIVLDRSQLHGPTSLAERVLLS